MTVNDILALVKAGYNSDQISQLYQMEKQMEQPQMITPAQQMQPQMITPAQQMQPNMIPQAQPKQELNALYGMAANQASYGSVPPQNPTDTMLANLSAQVQALTGAVQGQNILGANGNAPSQTTSEDVIAKIINPPDYANMGQNPPMGKQEVENGK